MSDKILFSIYPQHNLPQGMKYEDITNIDNYQDNSINSIVINDLLDYYSYNTDYDLLSLIKAKLIVGGSIEIQAPDIEELCIASANLKIGIDTIQSILYGDNKKSIHTIYDIINMLTKLGLQIIEKKYINIFEYYLLATKNEE